MSGETYPKEEQRMCNGASGQVPAMGREHSAFGDFLDLEWLRMPPASGEDATPVNQAIDTADQMLGQSLDMAQHVISHSPSERKEVLALATAHLQAAALLYAVNQLTAAIRRQPCQKQPK